MMSSPFPRTYEEWHHCITVDCDIPLTQAFITERLNVWRNAEAQETKRFVDLYGEPYLSEVIGWFERAAKETA